MKAKSLKKLLVIKEICSWLPSELDGQKANFRRFAPKSVTVATPLEQPRKEGRIDHAHPYNVPIQKIW